MKKQQKGRIHRTGSVPKTTVTKVTHSEQLGIYDECPCGYDKGVPWWLPLGVVVVTMVARVTYVVSPASYWVLHPDEVYQSIEVSFSEVYGYGFRAYEYLPPPDPNTTAPFMQHTLKSGMYALRSFMYPHVFTVVLHVFKFLRLDSNPYLICRVFNAMVTSTLPLAVYTFSIKLFKCRLVAFLSCVMAASGLQITVFGTRPLINSFISPFIFLALTFCIDTVQIFNGSIKSEDRLSPTKSSPDCNENAQANGDKSFLNGKIKQTYDHLTTSHIDIGENQHNSEINGKDLRKCTMIKDHGRHFYFTKISSLQPVLGGLILGFISYVRIDTVLFFSCFLLPIWTLRIRNDGHIPKSIFTKNVITFFVKILIGILLATCICVLDDTYHYGFGTLSPIQWFKFNVLSGKASLIFGRLDPQNYVSYFMAEKLSFLYLIFVIACYLLKKDLPFRSSFLSLLLSTGVIVLVYSSIGHKEERFLYNIFVIHSVIIGVAFHCVFLMLKCITSNKIYSLAIFALPIATRLFALFSQFPLVENNNVSKWNYGNALQSRDLNLCLEYIGHVRDVNGVLINGSIYDIGGYSILQHNVPMFVKVHFEFNLYESRVANNFSKTKDIKVLNDFQDFFHQSNYFYISKLFRKDKRFNYIISQSIPKDLEMNLNFTKTKHCGTFKVYRRETETPSNQKSVFGQYPAGNNATVLEYEANWLLTHGMYTKAIERIKRALELDRSRVRLYQQIVVCYERLGLLEESKNYQGECYRQHGREKCRTQQDKVVLHNEYKRFDIQH